MIRNKFTVGLRNKLSELAMSCDTSAAIEGARMTEAERETIQTALRGLVKIIDEKIKVQ